MEECVSVIILCYRRFEYVYSAIASTLAQDYPCVELIVSDDGSPNFPREELERYIEQNKKENIVRTLIRQEKKNEGTVRHLNHIIPECRGEYVVILAGDDAFYNESVLSKYAAGFSRAPRDCCVEMAQTGMYDEKLDALEDYYLKPLVQRAIEKTETDSGDLLYMLIKWGACLPTTSTCFRRSFFEKFGKFDETYHLVEDYPMHVRLAREGWIIHYENFVAMKHRHGGISHGQKGTVSASKALYYKDSIRMIEEIIWKNLDILPEKERGPVYRKKKKEWFWLNMQIAAAEKDKGRFLNTAMKNPGETFWRILDKLWGWAWNYRIKFLVLSLAMWAFAPIITDMITLFFPLEPERLRWFLYCGAVIVFAVWLIFFLIWGLIKRTDLFRGFR